ncbi:MAG TPA: Gfo/Idh/MocA family oxidoreductase [Spirochaetia bacterium]|nr:Gfo/Idh/MocA family oxidoreductase [Spirochaetia bacterium]
MIKAAVCGLGIGMAHCAGYLESEHADLVAVCDLLPERLASVGGTFESGSMQVLKPLYSEAMLGRSWESIGVRAYDSFDALLADKQIELISLCTPDYLHARQALQVLKSGRHLLLEKPLALAMGRGKSLVLAGADAGKKGIRCAIGYEFRVNPAIQKVKSLLDSGAAGAVHACTIYHYRQPFRRDKWHGWIQERSKSGGLIVEETSHWFDLARFLTDKELATVHGVATDKIHPDFDYEDIAFINATFADGGILQISHALTGFDFSLVITIHGTAGTIWCAFKEAPQSVLDARQTDYIAVVAWGPVNGGPENGQFVTFGDEAGEPETIRENVKAFAACIAGERPVPCTLSDGLAALEAALAAGVAVNRNAVVDLDSEPLE